MDRAEGLANKPLFSLGYTPIFEPNGEGTFPDFEVTPDLAVEVRSLNEHYLNNGRTKGLREGSQPLYDRMDSVFRKFDAQYEGRTYFASIHFARPLPKGTHIKKSVEHILSNFLEYPETWKRFGVAGEVSVTFMKETL